MDLSTIRTLSAATDAGLNVTMTEDNLVDQVSISCISISAL
jgi:hypothetical protein